MAHEYVTGKELAAILGIRLAEVREVVAGLKRRGRRRSGYRWSDLAARLGQRQRVALQRAERERRMQFRGSQYWVSGYPELVKQWHPTRNGGVWPDEVRYASRRRVWWKCPEGPDHEWQAMPNARLGGSTRGLSRCPFCTNRRVSVTNSLANRDPDVARQWHPTRNDGVRPRDVVYTSARMHWWKCPKGPDHEWRAVASSRTRKKHVGCPYCAGQRASVTNSLATRCPRVARDWHPTKNGALTPKDVTHGSRLHVWWRCTTEPRHVWKAEIRARAQRTKGCPFCSHRRLSHELSLAALNPRVARQWHPTKNGALRPGDVMVGSARKVWWKCRAAPDHEWRAQVWYRARTVKPVGCPFCAGLRASSTNSVAALSPRLAREWHPTKNGALRPRDVTMGSSRRIWWRCPRGPDHEWSATMRCRTGLQPGLCPFCQGRRVSVTNSLARLAPRDARQWHPTKNGKLRPEDVTTGSSIKAWWQCKVDRRHVWRSEIKGRVGATAACPFCAGVR